MLFNSPLFVFVFLPITLCGLYLITRFSTHRLAIVWLIVASAVFYGWFNAIYLPLLVALIVFNYLCGAKLSRDYRAGLPRPMLLAVGILVNLGVLAYFKYMNFFLGNANAVLNTHFSIGHVLLPLGISFFIFQKIAYLADSYKGETSSYTPLEFAVFVMYFPQLIAGPIVHHSELIPQLRHRFQFSPTDLSAGLCLFTMGLLKKVVLADPLASYADTLFGVASSGQGQSLIVSWSAALAFTFQIYYDFSGYTDMALGLALMMGIRLPLNFNSPYKALNIIDFWRRWHMTLSRFLRDYVYIPLGGNRRGSLRRYANLMITMMLGGLWHGAGWTFVAWGSLHGIYLAINHGWESARGYLAFEDTAPLTCFASRIATFVVVVVAWVFFRAQTFGAASVLLQGMLGFYGLLTPSPAAASLQVPTPIAATILVTLIVAVWTLPNSQEMLAHFRPAKQPVDEQPIVRLPALGRWGLIEKNGQLALTVSTGIIFAGALMCAMTFQAIRSANLQPFIYFQF